MWLHSDDPLRFFDRIDDCDSKGLAISLETLLLAASIDDDGTRSLSGPLGSGKTNLLVR